MNILVLDIGRTHVKACLIDDEGNITRRFETENDTVFDTGMSVFKIDRIWQWFLKILTGICKDTRIDAISTTTHGASAAFITASGEALDVLDYESGLYEEVSDEYNRLRDPYEKTFSPGLANGLNLGRQIFWLQKQQPALFKQVTAILTYPQYWSYRLSGVKSIEVTSLGTHTDLWLPGDESFSRLIEKCDWTSLFPNLRNAWESLGQPLPETCKQTGLNSDCRILCGIHDSNATFAYHYEPDKPMTLLSTGTWVIGMCAGSPDILLTESMDELANVNLLGEPLPSFRFMGGREWEILCDDIEGSPEIEDLQEIFDKDIFALPAFTKQGGPFRHLKGEIVGPAPTDLQTKALASLYCAQVSAWSLDRFGSTGRLIIDGPFINDAIFLNTLAALLPACEVLATDVSDGTALGAARLAIWPKTFNPEYRHIESGLIAGLLDYHGKWLKHLEVEKLQPRPH